MWSLTEAPPTSYIISQIIYVDLSSIVKPFDLIMISGQFLVQIGGIKPNRNASDKTLMVLYEAGVGKWADFLRIFKNHLWLNGSKRYCCKPVLHVHISRL